MVQRVGGKRRKTRKKLQKSLRQKGKISIQRYLQELKAGQKVSLLAEPSVQKGMFSPRFYGKIGVVKGKKGGCYEVEIKDGKTTKSVIAHPVHLKTV